jgi:hypothetical protein
MATERLVLFAEVKNAISMLPVAEWELTPREDDERTALLSTPIAVSILDSAERSFAVSLSDPRCFFFVENSLRNRVRHAFSINYCTVRERPHPVPGAHHFHSATQAQTLDETLSAIFASLAQHQCPKSMPCRTYLPCLGHWRNYYGQKNAASTFYAISISTAKNFDDKIYRNTHTQPRRNPQPRLWGLGVLITENGN